MGLMSQEEKKMRLWWMNGSNLSVEVDGMRIGTLRSDPRL